MLPEVTDRRVRQVKGKYSHHMTLNQQCTIMDRELLRDDKTGVT